MKTILSLDKGEIEIIHNALRKNYRVTNWDKATSNKEKEEALMAVNLFETKFKLKVTL